MIQKRIDKQEAEKFLKEFVFERCIKKMTTKFNDTNEEAMQYCKKVTTPSHVHYDSYKPQKYHLLTEYLSGKVLAKMLETYKDFGVQDDE